MRLNMTRLVAVLITILLSASAASPVHAAPPELGTGLEQVFENIIGLLAPAAAIAFFIMITVGGYKFLTAGGDPKSAAGARSTLTYAALGIILVIASWLILLVIQEVTNINVTNVEIRTN